MKGKFLPLLCWALVAGLTMVSCSKDVVDPGAPPERFPVDDSKTTKMTDFTPKDAAVRTILFIEGENFGTKLSNIKVYVGGKVAPVTGSNGKTITAMVPRNAAETMVDESNGLASLRVEILKDDGSVYFDKTFDEQLNVKIQTSVGTLAGYKDPSTGQSSRIDGTFEEAEFIAPWWLTLTTNKLGEKVLLLHDGEVTGDYGYLRAVREINLDTRMVSTVLTQNQIGINQGLSIGMDPAADTLFCINDNGKGEWNDRYAMPAIYYSLRTDGFTKARPYQYAQCCYSALWMADGKFYYNTYQQGMLLQGRGTYNAEAGMWDGTRLFSTWNNNSGHQFFSKHPEDLYMYVTGATRTIRKVPYDKVAGTFVNNVTVVAGTGSAGFKESTGPQAQFNYPRQCAFVKNPEYAGLEDQYDCYMVDQFNHCVWKVTPTGIATVFAGRGSVGLNSAVDGYIDGDPIKSARFFQPCGIVYDPETEIFYIADRQNRRIRTIMVE
jgi:hypothetical protein